jgi:uncharacterized membrane protein YphA (DoxX/SURF4 family)
MKTSKTIVDIITIVYIVLFLYAGISKIIDYQIFKVQLSDSPVLAPIAKPTAIALPIIEFVVVILLIIPRWRLRGFYASFILMILFTIYIIVIISFSKTIPCTCGGVLAELTWGQHIIFNSAFTALAIYGIFNQLKIKRSINEQLNLMAFSE